MAGSACIDCPSDSYVDVRGSDLASDCIACPSGSSTGGATVSGLSLSAIWHMHALVRVQRVLRGCLDDKAGLLLSSGEVAGLDCAVHIGSVLRVDRAFFSDR